MKTFHCQDCGHPLFFENVKCLQCGSLLAFLPERLNMSALEQVPGEDAVWLGPPPAAGAGLAMQVRAHADPVDAVVAEVGGGRVLLRPCRPVGAVAAGQTVALYDGDRVVGAVHAA